MIEAIHINKYYGSEAAVLDLCFKTDVRPKSAGPHEGEGPTGGGEVIGLLGLNGAGKTTTLRILSGLLVPTSGTVKIDGIDMSLEPERARAKVGFLPETPPLYPEMSVEGYLRFVGKIHGIRDKKILGQRVEEAMKATDILPRRHQRISELSHGFKRRVGIAHVIVHKPALILLDEPTSGLDPVQVVQMRELIRALKKEHTILLSSHMLGEIHEVCDRILVLKKGRLVAQGTESELRERLAKGRRLSIEARGDAQALQKLLDESEFVESAQVSKVSGQGETVSAEVMMATDATEHLVALMVESGFGLRRLEPAREELEEIFLDLAAQTTLSEADAAEVVA